MSVCDVVMPASTTPRRRTRGSVTPVVSGGFPGGRHPPASLRRDTAPVSGQAAGVVVVGPVSWNTIVQVPHLPDPRPQALFARDSWATLGGTSAGKALNLADLDVPMTLSTVLGTDAEADLIRTALSDGRIRLVAERVEGSS